MIGYERGILERRSCPQKRMEEVSALCESHDCLKNFLTWARKHTVKQLLVDTLFVNDCILPLTLFKAAAQSCIWICCTSSKFLLISFFHIYCYMFYNFEIYFTYCISPHSPFLVIFGANVTLLNFPSQNRIRIHKAWDSSYTFGACERSFTHFQNPNIHNDPHYDVHTKQPERKHERAGR